MDTLRVAATTSPRRCPFCHGDVDGAERSTVCAGCLARHHVPCWDEAQRCSTCGTNAALEPRVPASRWNVGRWIPIVGVAFVLGLVAGRALAHRATDETTIALAAAGIFVALMPVLFRYVLPAFFAGVRRAVATPVGIIQPRARALGEALRQVNETTLRLGTRTRTRERR